MPFYVFGTGYYDQTLGNLVGSTTGYGRVQVYGGGYSGPNGLGLNSLTVAQSLGANGQVDLQGSTSITVNGGNLGDYGTVRVARDAGAVGVLNVGDGSYLTVTGQGASRLEVARYGNGTLNIYGGSQVSAFFLEAARNGTSTTTISDYSTLRVSGAYGQFQDSPGVASNEGAFARVGREAGSSATITVESGGHLSVLSGNNGGTARDGANVTLGQENAAGGLAASYGRIDVDGSGSVFEVVQYGDAAPGSGASVSIGQGGQGIVAVGGGATMNVLGDRAKIEVANGRDTDAGVANSTTAQSLLLVQGGATVLVDSQAFGGSDGGSSVQVANGRGTNGRISVDGAGTTLTVRTDTDIGDPNDNTISDYRSGGIRIGTLGTGQLDVTNGAVVRGRELEAATDAAILDVNGVITQQSRQALANPDVSGSATININSGGQLILQTTDNASYRGFDLAIGSGTTAIANVSGVGTLVESSGGAGRISIGRYGTGRLNIDGGAEVRGFFGRIGDEQGGNGSVYMTGSGSMLTFSDAYGTFPGYNGDFLGASASVTVGYANGAYGKLNLRQGGTVNVRNDATRVDAQGNGGYDRPILRFGDQEGSLGVLDIAGPGTSLNVVQYGKLGDLFGTDGATLLVGRQGQGMATIANLATANILGAGARLIVGESGANNALAVQSSLEILSGAVFTIDSQTYSGDEQIPDGQGGYNPIPTGSYAVVGKDAGGNGYIKVDGTGSTLQLLSGAYVRGDEVSGGLTIGDLGTGLVTVTNFGALNAEAITVGGYYQDNETTFDAGNGTLNVTSGGTVIASAKFDPASQYVPYRGIEIGSEKQTVGVVNVDGAGSVLTSEGGAARIRVGRYGDGTLNITNGGKVNGFFGDIGRENGGRGTVTIDGAGSSLLLSDQFGRFGFDTTNQADFSGNAAFLRTGRNDGSYGKLSIVNGGSAHVINDPSKVDAQGLGGYDAPGFQMARNTGSDGVLEIDGTGSLLRIQQYGQLGDLYATGGAGAVIGRAGQAVATLSNGGQLQVLGAGAQLIVSDRSDVENTRAELSTLSILSGSQVTVDSQTYSGYQQFPNGQGGTFGVRLGARVGVGEQVGADGLLIVDGAGSTLELLSGPFVQDDFLSGELEIGQFGRGVVTARNGGLITAQEIEVGMSRFENPTNGNVYAGDGTLNVLSGATVTLTTKDDPASNLEVYRGLRIAEAADTQGDVNVGGAGSVLTVQGGAGRIRVANYGTGTLDVTDFGQVNAFFLEIGRENGGNGTVTVDGLGSSILLSDEFGEFGYSQTQSEDFGGTGGFLRIGRKDGSYGKLDIKGGGSVSVINDPNGVADGPAVGIGRDYGSSGILNIDGAGSVLNIIQLGPIGDSGNPRNTFGPELKIGSSRADANGGGSGTVTVSNGGVINVIGEDADIGLGVGQDAGGAAPSGQAIMNVNTGGIVNLISISQAQGTYFEIGLNATGTGQATFTGAGTQLNLTSNVNDPDEPNAYATSVNVGVDGTGVLNILDGAKVLMNGTDDRFPFLSAGFSAGANGNILVDGAGSSITIQGINNTQFGSGGSIAIGRYGAGVLTIQNGGVVTNSNTNSLTTIGRESGSVGVVKVDGATSNFLAGLDLGIGTDVDFANRTFLTDQGGTGELELRQGATVTATNTTVGATGSLIGQGTVIGSVNVLDGNLGAYVGVNYAPGGEIQKARAAGSIDQLVIAGNLDVSAASKVYLEYEVGEPADLISVTGTATIEASALAIEQTGSTAMAAGQTFTLIQAGTLQISNVSRDQVLIDVFGQVPGIGASTLQDALQPQIITASTTELKVQGLALDRGLTTGIADFSTATSTGVTIDLINGYGAGNGGDFENFIVGGVTAVVGTGMDDMIAMGTTTGVSVDAGAGNDLIATSAGNDTIIAGEGNDTINAGIGDDDIDLGPGEDVVIFTNALADYDIQVDQVNGITTVIDQSGGDVTDGTDRIFGTGTLQFSDDLFRINGGPSLNAPSDADVPENTTSVVDIAATDDLDAEGDGLTYALAGGADQGFFQIDATTGLLEFIAAPDFETPQDADANNIYNVTVQVTDGDGASDTQAIAVAVRDTDENLPPSLNAPASVNVAENTTLVSDINATDDRDSEGNGLSYSITGGADGAFFRINAATGILEFESPPDFEFPDDANGDNEYEVEVTVTDLGRLTSAETILVTVTNVDEDPVLGAPAVIDVVENTTAVIDLNATDDIDAEGGDLTYSISGGVDAGFFQLDPQTGVLAFFGAPDFEAPEDAGTDNTYDVEITVTDGSGNTDLQTITVAVQDTNEAPSLNAVSPINAFENATLVADFAATDDRDIEGGDLGYSITGGVDQALFQIDGVTGVLTFIAAPDFEAPLDANGDNDYQVDVTVTDGGGLTEVQALTITVENVNEAPSLNAPAATNVQENTTAVLDLTATDAEDAEGSGLTYALVGGVDQPLFQIDAATGALSFIAAPDFEAPQDLGANNVYNVEVQVADSGGDTDIQAIAITVQNVNESPALNAPANVNVVEGTTAVVDLNATDPEDSEGSGLTYSLVGGVDQAFFQIDGPTGALSFVAAPDFDAPQDQGADNVYNVEVQVADSGGDTDIQAIAVTVVDDNVDLPPALNLPASIDVDEGTTAVTDINATDDRDAEGNGLTYGITGGADAGFFQLDAQTGVLAFLGALDFEAPEDAGTDNGYDVVITVTDTVGQTDTQAVTVNVRNVNEAPSLNAATPIAINEGLTLVADFDATDDIDFEGGDLGYAITGGDDQALFQIDGVTGALSFIAAPDFENPGDTNGDNAYEVDVTVTDGGGLTETQSLVVTVNNANDPPNLGAPANIAVDENTTAIVDLNATDLEDAEGNGLTYAITGGADQNALTIDAATGTLDFIAAPDFENPGDANGDNSFEVEVTVTDTSGAKDTDAISVTVQNVNEGPVLLGAPGFTQPENRTAVGNFDANDDQDAEGAGLTYSLSGTDAALFAIDASGALNFFSTPDFENPGDSNADNIYELTVTVTDSGGLTDLQAITVTITDEFENRAPTLTFATTAPLVFEETTAVLDFGANDDVDSVGNGLTFSITGGADQAAFTISATGSLSFITAPDFENPTDVGSDNVYDVDVTVTDSGGLTDTQSLAVTIQDVIENVIPPTITSAATATVAENTTAVIDVQSTDDADAEGAGLTYSISGGADQALFSINAATGVVVFTAAPDFEAPGDANGDNDYLVQVTVTDSDGQSDVQDLTVTVTDVFENQPPVAEDDTVSVDRAVVRQGDVLADNGNGLDSDPEARGPLTVTAVNGQAASVGAQVALASGAVLTVRADGTFDYDATGAFATLTAGGLATETFTYQITDVDGSTDTATVTFEVGVQPAFGAPPTANGLAILGTPSDNVIAGTIFADSIIGGAGDDIIRSGLGADTITFGDTGNPLTFGSDQLWGTVAELDGDILVDFQSNDAIGVLAEDGTVLAATLTVGGGQVQIDALNDGTIDAVLTVSAGLAGNGTGLTGPNPFPAVDVTTGTAANETLFGTGGNDQINGLGGNDTLVGSLGSDVLNGGPGADVSFGGAGADLFVLATGGGTDIAADFQLGSDLIQLNGATAAQVQISPYAVTSTRLELPSGDALILQGIAPSALAGQTIFSAAGGGAPGIGRVSNDLNSNGVSDVLWFNTATQGVLTYKPEPGGYDIQSLGFAGPNYEVKGIGDFSGDGTADILWYNPVTNQIGFYAMDSGNPVYTPIDPGGTEWEIAGIGDFDGDNTDDILWYNDTTNGIGYYDMQSGVATWVPLTLGGPDWVVEATGDFSGDGITDVLWYNTGTRQFGFHDMDNGVPDFQFLDTAGPDWRIAGAGDFTGDNTDDLLWINPVTNGVGYHEIMGGQVVGWNDLGQAGAGYTPVGVGDYSGDGTDDILWFNTQTRAIGYYEMDSGAPVWRSFGTGGPDWEVAGLDPAEEIGFL